MDITWLPYGIPTPEKEYRFDKVRRWRFDYAWPDHGQIAVEIEGGIWTHGRHTRGSGFHADMGKYNMASKAGWRVFRFTPSELKKGIAQAFIKEILGD